jgi:hypothetical protein
MVLANSWCSCKKCKYDNILLSSSSSPQYQVSVAVHLQDVVVPAQGGVVVVLGDLGLVLHEDLHAELLLRGGVVRLA